MLLTQLHYLCGGFKELTSTCEIVNEDIGVKKNLLHLSMLFE